ncbi:MAG: Asp-tRNA(Asn)/Glu-tRNA(Gln) amidotransferase subunit GatA [Ignavibacteria bacterium]
MLSYKNHTEKLHQIKSGQISLTENINHFLHRIETFSRLNAFNSVFAEDALTNAEHISQKIINGTAGKLAGMVVAVKDVIAIKDKPLTCSSKMLKDFTSLYDATVIERLKKEDAIIIGKTSCDEFAMGSSNENSAFGPVLNPIDNSRVPGGSSGGSAVAVAARLCDVSLGSDTGGSIRQPASFCGIFGLKPTYGRVSRYGLTAFASSFDSIGPLANNTEDIALVMSVIAGHDRLDSTSSEQPSSDYLSLAKDITISKNSRSGKPRIGIPKEYFGEGINPEVKSVIENFIEKLKTDGFEVKEISLPKTEFSIAIYYILTTAEASSNLARYDGARYGFRSDNSESMQQMYQTSRSGGLGSEVKRRIMLGTYVLSAGYYDAYYKKAQKVRRLLKEDFDNAFTQADLILTPTSPFAAFKLGEKSSDPLEMYLSDIYTTSANLAGIPGISIPVGRNSEGMPVGMQLMANQFDEEMLLKISLYIENNLL